MVLAYDFLDSMMWAIVVAGVLIGVAALKLPYNAKKDVIDKSGKTLATGIGISLGAVGIYLFLNGILHHVQWQYAMSSGAYNILFGSAAALSGLVLVSAAIAFVLGQGLRPVSYFAAVVGAMLVVDALAIFNYGMTSDPTISGLNYLAPAIVMLFSVLYTHVEHKIIKYVFTIGAFGFAITWLLEAASVTYSHLNPG